jgi:hypothetical protein
MCKNNFAWGRGRFYSVAFIGILAGLMALSPGAAYAFCPECAPAPALGAGAVSWAALALIGAGKRWLGRRLDSVNA